MTLVEHTRIYVRQKYKGHYFWDEYQDRVRQDFGTWPLSHFVQDLRDYFVHRTVPLTSAHLSQKEPPTINLHPGQMQDWDRWSPLARQFIAEEGGPLQLESLIDSYEERVARFYRWLEDRIRTIHKSELDDYWRMGKELERMEQREKNQSGG